MATVLAIAAHPDDELFGAGYLAKLAAEGNDLYILCTTRGEGGEVGEPPVGPKSRLGEFRVVEMQGSGRALGAREVWFLDFVDPWMEIGGEALAIDAEPADVRRRAGRADRRRSSPTSSSPTARTASTAIRSTSTPTGPCWPRSARWRRGSRASC